MASGRAPRAGGVPPDRPPSEPAVTAEVLAGLLQSASRGEESAWWQIVGLYARRVYGLAKSRCRNRDVADEITQSVFVTVASKLGQGLYVEQGRFEAWLFRVAMNRVRDHIRHARRTAGLEGTDGAIDRHASGTPDPAEERAHAAHRATQIDELQRAMNELSDADREIVELRHHGGLSFKQMADLLGEPMGTLLARHHRALRKLKDLMEPGQHHSPADGPGRHPRTDGPHLNDGGIP